MFTAISFKGTSVIARRKLKLKVLWQIDLVFYFATGNLGRLHIVFYNQIPQSPYTKPKPYTHLYFETVESWGAANLHKTSQGISHDAKDSSQSL